MSSEVSTAGAAVGETAAPHEASTAVAATTAAAMDKAHADAQAAEDVAKVAEARRVADEEFARAAARAAISVPLPNPAFPAGLESRPKTAGASSSVHNRGDSTGSGAAPVAGAVGDEEPVDYLCPITHELMVDPVVTADGQSYERAAIEQWLKHSTLSPLTNEPLVHLAVTPNMALKRLICEWLAQRKGSSAQPTGQRGRAGGRQGTGGGACGGNRNRASKVGGGATRPGGGRPR